MSLDDEFALFEKEIATLTSETPAASDDKPSTQPAAASAPVPAQTASSASRRIDKVTVSGAFVPAQVRASKYDSGATISEAPALYNTSKTSKSSLTTKDGPGSSGIVLEQPPQPPQVTQALPYALPQDVELLAAKRLTSTAYENSYIGQVLRGERKMKRFVRTAGGQTWEDPSLAEWDPNDFRVFCGDLGNEVSDELLAKAFRKYPSFQKAKVVRDGRSNKSKGFGFVSFRCQDDFVRAIREMDGKYVGNRPIKLRKSNWKDRNMELVRKKQKQKAKLGIY